MINRCNVSDFLVVRAIINDAAEVYRGVIPSDMWKTPYMTCQELKKELDDGVVFYGHWGEQDLLGVMGIQDVEDVTLIRHAYVRRYVQRQGIGEKLLKTLRKKTNKPVLIGTWRDATWAIKFYEKHGFQMVSQTEKDRLLRKYWGISDRQIETSIVLADEK
jgi:N-acetylglutamate synthase-like GNAT family acetyltransferase